MTTINKPFIKSRPNGYGQNPWEGSNYSSSLTVKDIAKIIRKELKAHFPTCKFSVTSDVRHLSIALMSDVKTPFTDPNMDVAIDVSSGKPASPEDIMHWWKNSVEKGYETVSIYHIDNDYKLTDDAKTLFKFVKSLANSFNFDESDAMTDYFHTNFYLDLSIGRWNKPFIIKS